MIFHSDRGVKYAREEFRNTLANNVMQSMSRNGNCRDNAVAEIFFNHMRKRFFISSDSCCQIIAIEILQTYFFCIIFARLVLKIRLLTEIISLPNVTK